MGEFAIGQSVPRFEDPRLVQGGGRYVGDMVLPGMAFGYVLRSPHAHARIRSIDTSAAKAAPGVLAVLTGADWQASGWGDLPVPGGLTRRDGSVFKPPYPALAKDRVRWVGDYVAFVVAETYHQAMDAAELIEVDYEPLPAVDLDRGGERAGRAAGLGRLRRQYRLRAALRRQGRDRRRLRQGRPRRQASLRDQPRHRRHHGAARLPRRLQRRRRPLHHLHDACSARIPSAAELAPILKVPESKIRVVAGDIGGSFGMKSAVYNEVALVLLASKTLGRPVKWISHALGSPSCATPRRATTSPRPSWRSTRTATSSACASTRRRQHRRLSADRHAGLHRQYRHAGRRLSHPRRSMST